MVPITDSPTVTFAPSLTFSRSTSYLVAASTSSVTYPLLSAPSDSPTNIRRSNSKCLGSIRRTTFRRKMMPVISRKRRISPLLMHTCTHKICSVVLADTLKNTGSNQRDNNINNDNKNDVHSRILAELAVPMLCILLSHFLNALLTVG